MSTVSATLSSWARRTRSSFGMRWLPAAPVPEEQPEDGLVYRLKAWPDLPAASRTADVYRLLSVMSHRPVNRGWMLANTRLEAGTLEALLRRLVRRGAVEVIDSARIQPERS